MSRQLPVQLESKEGIVHPTGEEKRDYGKLVAGKEKQGIGEGARKGAGAGVGCGFCAPAKQLYRFHYHN